MAQDGLEGGDGPAGWSRRRWDGRPPHTVGTDIVYTREVGMALPAGNRMPSEGKDDAVSSSAPSGVGAVGFKRRNFLKLSFLVREKNIMDYSNKPLYLI